MSNPYLTGTAYSNALLDNIWQLSNTIVVQGNYLYATSEESFMIMDVSDPTSPFEVFRGILSAFPLYNFEPYSSTNYEEWGTDVVFARNIKIQGSYVYYVTAHPSYLSRLFIVDISNPKEPERVGSLAYAGSNLTDVYVEGNYAYVCSEGSNFLSVVNISDKTAPSQIGLISGASIDGPVNITKRDNYILLSTDDTKNITIVDVADKTNPVVFATISEPVTNYFAALRRIKVYDNFLYIAGSTYLLGFAVYDIYNIDDPKLVGYYRGTGNYAENIDDFAIDGDYLYAFDDNGYITVLDITDKTNVTLAGVLGVTSGAGGIYVDSGYIYLAKRTPSEGCFSYTTTELQASIAEEETEEVIGESMQDLHRNLTYRLNIAEDVNQRAEEAKFWSDTELLRAINEGYLDFVRRTECLQRFETISLVADQIEYDLPSDCIKLLWVGDGVKNLHGQSLDYMDMLDDGWMERSGEPAYFVQELGGLKKIQLYETPETSGISTFTADTNHTEADADTGIIIVLEDASTEITATADSNHSEADEDTGMIVVFTGESVLLPVQSETGAYFKLDQQTANIMILFAYEPQEFNNLTEAKTPGFMAAYHIAIVHFALSELYLKEGETQNIPLSNFYRMLYEEAVENKLATSHVSNLKMTWAGGDRLANLPSDPHLPYDTYPAYRR